MQQVNAVPNRPEQAPEHVAAILKMLLWTILPTGETQKRKHWNITNHRDAHVRAFGYKLLTGFLPTLARQRAWYPEVYNRPELFLCAKCSRPDETQEHIFECANQDEVTECFRAKFRALQPREVPPIDPAQLDPEPWNQLGQLQGRVWPSWKSTISSIHQSRGGPAKPAAVIQQLLRASLEATYQAIWLPRCQRTIEQERRHALHQGTKLHRMRTRRHNRTRATPSPTHKLPRSFIDVVPERREAYRAFLSG